MTFPIIGDVRVTAGVEGKERQILPQGTHFDYEATPLIANVKTDWGVVDVYMSKNKMPSAKTLKSVLSAGFHQFNNYALSGLPYSIIMNVKPFVPADAPSYPFNKQREGWSPLVLLDVRAVSDVIKKIVFLKESAVLSNVFQSMKLIVRKEDGSYGLMSPPQMSQSSIQSLLKKPLQFYVKDGSISMGVGAELFNDLLAQGEGAQPCIETDKPVYISHYNIDPIVEAAKRTGKHPKEIMNCIGEFSYITRSFLDKIIKIPNVCPSRIKKPLYGVFFHKFHRGENIATPQHALLINPIRDIGETPAAWAHGWIHTCMHETTHWSKREHDAPFVSGMSDLYSLIEDHCPGLYMQTMQKLKTLAVKNWSVFLSLREVQNDNFVKNVEIGSAHNNKIKTGQSCRPTASKRTFSFISAMKK